MWGAEEEVALLVKSKELLVEYGDDGPAKDYAARRELPTGQRVNVAAVPYDGTVQTWGRRMSEQCARRTTYLVFRAEVRSASNGKQCSISLSVSCTIDHL